MVQGSRDAVSRCSKGSCICIDTFVHVDYCQGGCHRCYRGGGNRNGEGRSGEGQNRAKRPGGANRVKSAPKEPERKGFFSSLFGGRNK